MGVKVMGAKGKTRDAQISARVWRAKIGKWEDLGIISSTNQWVSFKIKIIELKRRICAWLKK